MCRDNFNQAVLTKTNDGSPYDVSSKCDVSRISEEIFRPGVSLGQSRQSDAQQEAAKIELLILSGNATELQSRIMADKKNPDELRATMQIVHDDLAKLGIDVQYRQRRDDAQVFVGSNGRTILDFGDNMSVYGRPMIGEREAGSHTLGSYGEGGGHVESGDDALRRVLSEAGIRVHQHFQNEGGRSVLHEK